MLGKESSEVGILALGEEFIMIRLGDWGLRRCEVALLRCEEAGLARCVDLGGRSSRRMRSGSGTRGGRGREGKIDSIGEESVYGLPSVSVSNNCSSGRG